MPRRLRRRTRRVRRRRARRRGRMLRRTIRRVATRAINRSIETKILRTGVTNSTLMTDGTIYVHNPTYQIVPGTGDNNRLGRKIQRGRLTVNFGYEHLGESPITPFPRITPESYIRMFVVRSAVSKIPTAIGYSANPSGINPAEMFYEASQPLWSPIQENRWEVVYDRVFKAKATTDDVLITPNTWTSLIRRNIRIPWGKRLVYEDETGAASQSFLRGKEQYLCFVASFVQGSQNGERIGTLTTNCQFRFKDA